MTCASLKALTALLLVSCQYRVTHPWTLNPSAAKYYRPIRLAAGFQKCLATPASYQMQFHMAISIAYYIGMKKDHQTLLNFAILAGKWQKMHLFIEVVCKKFCGWAKRGFYLPIILRN